MTFVHLHVHSCYSLLDGLPTIEEVVETTKKFNMPAVTLTDHGNLFGSFKFHKACTGAGLKPILGQEFYFVPDRRTKDRAYRHLVLLAKNKQGWQNLIALSNHANESGFYYRPRIDIELVKAYHEGLILLTACQRGIISDYLLAQRPEKAERALKNWRNIFGDDLYLELMPLEGDRQQRVNKFLVDLAGAHSISLVATADSHYLEQTDWEVHSIMLRIRNAQAKGFEGKDLWFRSEIEMLEGFAKNHPELKKSTCEAALANAWEVMERVETFRIGSTGLNIPQIAL